MEKIGNVLGIGLTPDKGIEQADNLKKKQEIPCVWTASEKNQVPTGYVGASIMSQASFCQ